MSPSHLHRSLVLGLGLIVLACGGGGGGSSPAPQPPPAPANVLQSIGIAPAAPSLNIGGSVDLTATASYSDGSNGAIDNSAVWASSSPSVASVSAMGVVTGLTAGTTTISAAKDGRTGSATVTVNASAVSLIALHLSPGAGNLTTGQTLDFTATADWSNGTSTVPYDSNVTWVSSNPAVAAVNAGGVVTGIANGNATITASASGVTASASVSVAGAAAALTGLTMLQSTSSLQVGQTTGIVVMAHWSNGTTTSPYTQGVTWASSNTAVATATPNATGCTVTGISAGTATITATASGYTTTAGFGVAAATPTFDARLVGSWQWVGMLNANTSVGSFYHFYANGTFTYSLIQQTSSGCIAFSQVVAYHEGTFSSVGSLDNPASAGRIVMTCSTHHTDWTTCAGSTNRTTAVDPNGNATPNPHFHWAAFINGNTLATNHGDDFMATGTLNHARQ